MQNSCVLTRPDVRRLMNPAWEQVVLGLELGLLDPGYDRIPCGLSDFELNGPLSFTLHHHGSVGDPIAVAEVRGSRTFRED